MRLILNYIFICVYGLLVLLFVFFKQKTAYEMRISDWSSDVCSSDLAAKLAAQMPMRGKGRQACVPNQFRICAPMPQGQRQYAHQSAITVVAFICTAEIGRASCRERVCQYV